MKNFVIVCVVLFAFHQAAFASPIVSVSASDTQLSQSDNVQFSYMISGLSASAGDSLSAFDVNVVFDPTVLSLTGFGFNDSSFGNQLDFAEPDSFGFFGDTFESNGVVDAFAVSGNSSSLLDSNQNNAFVFLTLSFNVINNFDFSDVFIDLEDTTLLFTDSTSTPFSVLFTDSSIRLTGVTPVQVPTPNSFALLLVCITAIFLSRKPAKKIRLTS